MLVLMVFAVKVLALRIDCICIADVYASHSFRLFAHVAHTRLVCTHITCIVVALWLHCRCFVFVLQGFALHIVYASACIVFENACIYGICIAGHRNCTAGVCVAH